MRELIQKLPLDIVLQIIPYTYRLQNKDLLNDIKNYSETKLFLMNYYYNYWILFISTEEPEDKYWLINNIFIYANSNVPTMNGYVKKFYDIFKRNTYLKNNQDVERYLVNFEKKDVTSQINIFLGLMTLQERIEFIDIHNL
jgi:hypothetical protein